MSTFRALPIVAAMLAAFSGCGPSRVADSANTPFPTPKAATPTPSARLSAEDAVAAGSALTVPQVVALALRHNPTRAVFAANRRLAAARLLQAQAWDNPEAEVELGRATTTEGEKIGIGRLSVRQRLPWPGKRSARIDAAQAEGAVANGEARSFVLELVGDVTATAFDIAIDQRALEQAQVAQGTAKEVLRVVEQRLAEGEASKSDALRAQVESLQADQMSAALASDVSAARARLNALCEGVLPDLFTITASLDQFPITSHEESITIALAKHPEFLRLQSAVRQHQLEVERERTAAYPDVTVGVFSGKETDSRSVGATLGVDVPLWNRNQGGIEAAKAEVDRAFATSAVQRVKIMREVDAAWRDYEKARSQVERYDKKVRPVAQEALRLALSSYQTGETSLLDLLDARRTAQGIESSLLDAVRQAHAARIRLDLATGSIADTTAGTSP